MSGPPRMRLATFRMTLESSTNMQRFISGPSFAPSAGSVGRLWPTRYPSLLKKPRKSERVKFSAMRRAWRQATPFACDSQGAKGSLPRSFAQAARQHDLFGGRADRDRHAGLAGEQQRVVGLHRMRVDRLLPACCRNAAPGISAARAASDRWRRKREFRFGVDDLRA